MASDTKEQVSIMLKVESISDFGSLSRNWEGARWNYEVKNLSDKYGDEVYRVYRGMESSDLNGFSFKVEAMSKKQWVARLYKDTNLLSSAAILNDGNLSDYVHSCVTLIKMIG